ncbi:MAG: hypothetical protein RJB17_2164, partial [Pseudomonadota bacterium]
MLEQKNCPNLLTFKSFTGREKRPVVLYLTSTRHGAHRTPAFGGMNPLTPSGLLRSATGGPVRMVLMGG